MYDDLPQELQGPLEDVLIPEEVRRVIASGWLVMTEVQRRNLRAKVRHERDSIKRVLIANYNAVLALMHQEPETLEL